ALLLDDHVAALRAKGDLDRVGQLVDARLQSAAGILVELEDLRHYFFTFARTSRPVRISRSSPSTTISVPPYFEYTTVSPTDTSSGMISPVVSARRPGP